MRKLVASTLLGFGLMVAAVSTAQAQCLLCFGAGYLLGSSGSETPPDRNQSGLTGETLYIMPNAAERITAPLEIKQISTGAGVHLLIDTSDYKGAPRSGDKVWSVRALFQSLITDADQYEVVAVQRYFQPFDPEGSRSAKNILLLTFIHKQYVKPLPVATQ